MKMVMNMCWVKSANQRPTAEAVRHAIQAHTEVLDSRRSRIDSSTRLLIANIDRPDTPVDHRRIYDILTCVSGRSVPVGIKTDA
jgi:hypothetical protein